MLGGSEHVVGSAAGMTMNDMSVPEWKLTRFVTNEIWDVFNYAATEWIETGNITGYGQRKSLSRSGR